jgi:hypothetical protein
MASILVLACIDPRFTEVLFNYLNHQAQVHSDYDLFVLAGASLGAIQGVTITGGDTPFTPPTISNDALAPKTWPVTATLPGYDALSGASWTNAFYDHIKVALTLHNITEVWAFDHLDCGAYKSFQLGTTSDDLDVAPHATNLDNLNKVIQAKFAADGLFFKGFVIHGPEDNYRIEKTMDTGGIVIPDPSGSRTRDVLVILFITLLLLAIILVTLQKK